MDVKVLNKNSSQTETASPQKIKNKLEPWNENSTYKAPRKITYSL